MQGVIALPGHGGRPHVAPGTYEQATGARDTARLIVDGHTQGGPTLRAYDPAGRDRPIPEPVGEIQAVVTHDRPPHVPRSSAWADPPARTGA